MEILSVKLSERAVTGKKVKRLRQQGTVPVHVYGGSGAPATLQAEAQVLGRILPQVGTNIPLHVEVEGVKGQDTCFIREVQRHPVTEDLLHVDFLRVDVARSIQAEVPIVMLGDPPAVRDLGGTLLQTSQTVLVEALPMQIPASVQIDVSGLDDFEKAVYIRELSVESDVTVISSPDDLIARVMPPRKLEELEVAEEAAEAEVEGEGEGEVPVEGEAPEEKQPS